MEDIKRKILLNYLQGKLAYPVAKHDELIKQAFEIARIEYAIKYQILEDDGPAEEGRAWLSVNAMAHSFYYNEKTKTNVGTYIWEKADPIFFSGSLLHGKPRTQSIQMLQNGYVVSISYENLLNLLKAFPVIAKHVEDLGSLREQRYQQRITHLSAPTPERIIQFEANNPNFSCIANSTIKAMHVGLCRQTYNAVKKKINDQNNNQSDDAHL